MLSIQVPGRPKKSSQVHKGVILARNTAPKGDHVTADIPLQGRDVDVVVVCRLPIVCVCVCESFEGPTHLEQCTCSPVCSHLSITIVRNRKKKKKKTKNYYW